MKHPNELDQQLDNLRTLQQSYDVLADRATYANITNEAEAVQAIDDITAEIYVVPNNEQEEQL